MKYIVFLLVIFVGCSARTNNISNYQITTSEDECKVDEDCTIVSYGCGLAVAVAKKHLDSLKQFDMKLNQEAISQCLAQIDVSSMNAYCLEGICSKYSKDSFKQSFSQKKDKEMVYGSMDPDYIRSVLRNNIPRFSSCYEKHNKTRGFFHSYTLAFTIGSKGKVIKETVIFKNPSISTHINLGVCIKEQLSKLQFTPPIGGGTVDVVQPLRINLKRRERLDDSG